MRARIAIVAVTIYVTGGAAALAGWQTQASTDPLDTKKPASVSVYVESTSPISQHGRSVKSWIVVNCYRPTFGNDGPKLTAALNFSERVTFSERMVRWRVDERPIQWLQSHFYGDGKQFYFSGNEAFVSQLRAGKTLKIDADLPWAGRSLLSFDITGAEKAFSSIPCRPGR